MPTRSPETPPKTAPKKKGEKLLSNPTSTGGGGVTYETRVQAVYLFAMFTGGSPSVFPDAEVVELRFQGRIHGYRTEDLVCTLKDASGATRKALVQVKLTLKAVPSHAPFCESIVAAWYDYNEDTLFEKGRDRLVLVYARDADRSIYFASQLTQFARTSLTGAEFAADRGAHPSNDCSWSNASIRFADQLAAKRASTACLDHPRVQGAKTTPTSRRPLCGSCCQRR